MTQALTLKPPDSLERATLWLAEAIDWSFHRGATDLHLFPSENEAWLWVRIDGELREVCRYSTAIHRRMIARLKVLGRCTDYAGELAQEGRFTLNGNSAGGEARLSIVPTLHGDKAVIRLLGGTEKLRRLDQLGFSAELVDALRNAMNRPQGMLVAIGPSGCGKSTALYTLLHDLHQRTGHPLSIVTVEDPIEQSLPFAAQLNVDAARGFGFSAGLKALLRQDPEVIMIGEIRDAETSTTALQAALTGHRLLTSMHTLNAAEALVRLQQMGSPAFVISSALAGILNLRLVKLLCPHCKQERAITPEETGWLAKSVGDAELKIAESSGCDQCLNSGHQGRMGIGEWLTPTADTADALQLHQPAAKILQTLSVGVSARPSAMRLLSDGRISITEFQRLFEMTSVQLAELNDKGSKA